MNNIIEFISSITITPEYISQNNNQMNNIIEFISSITITPEYISQIVILVTGVLAAWLSQDHRYSHRRYACIIAMAGQPCWFFTTYISEQWGMFILCFFYTASWAKGVFNYWIVRR